MACPEVWLKLRPVIKILFVSRIIAFCATVVGFYTPVWISERFNVIVFSPGHDGTKEIANYLGIWQACGGDVSGCMNINKDLPAFLIATRAFACLGLIGAVITTTLVFIYSCLLKRETDRVLTVSMIFSFVTAPGDTLYKCFQYPVTVSSSVFFIIFSLGVLLAISLALFGGGLGKYYLSFSFAMVCIASILYVVNGMLCLVRLCLGPDAPPYVPHHADI